MVRPNFLSAASLALSPKGRSLLTPKILTVNIAGISHDATAYISDLHVADPGHSAYRRPIPRIHAGHGQLALCGDIGLPTDPRFRELFAQVSADFDDVYFVPGNHDYDCTSMYRKSQVDRYLPYIQDVCSSFPNVHLLDNAVAVDRQNQNKVQFAGTTLWSRPIPRSATMREHTSPDVLAHIRKHERDVHWLQSVVEQKNQSTHDHKDTRPVVVLSHFVPTMKLIEEKYQKLGAASTSWFATNLESSFMYPGSPVVGWIAGHSHSTLECAVHGTACGLHASPKE